jgi:hypothetical protein
MFPLFLSDFNVTAIFSTDFQNMVIYENPPSGSRVVPCGQTDGWTDMTKLIVAFRNFENAPEKEPDN